MGELTRKTREHFGRGRLKIDAARAVFINCPFDSEFAPIFDSIVFAVTSCGFMPRSALESGDVAEPRFERIVRAICSSKYSIHDLSRCSGEGDAQLARFNMPLELGMAMARRFSDQRKHLQHDWLVLVPEGHAYLKFVSDLAGFDPLRHNGRPESVAPKVMAWLATRVDTVSMPTPKEVLAKLPIFSAEMAHLREQWEDHPPWADVVGAAIDVSRSVVPPGSAVAPRQMARSPLGATPPKARRPSLPPEKPDRGQWTAYIAALQSLMMGDDPRLTPTEARAARYTDVEREIRRRFPDIDPADLIGPPPKALPTSPLGTASPQARRPPQPPEKPDRGQWSFYMVTLQRLTMGDDPRLTPTQARAARYPEVEREIRKRFPDIDPADLIGPPPKALSSSEIA